jgi:hypothetical protein
MLSQTATAKESTAIGGSVVFVCLALFKELGQGAEGALQRSGLIACRRRLKRPLEIMVGM